MGQVRNLTFFEELCRMGGHDLGPRDLVRCRLEVPLPFGARVLLPSSYSSSS